MKTEQFGMGQVAKRGSVLFVTVLVTSALGLAACKPVMPEGTTTPATEVTTAPSGEATEMPTAEATVEVSGEAADAVSKASQALAEELKISADRIEVVSSEAVEWPDSCLGVTSADTMCAQVITPGYSVVLSVDGKQYEVHTNADGTSVMIASGLES